MNEINYYLSQIQNHPDGVHSFPTFARERSDCSSFRNDGDLGVFGRGMMQRPFEESAFGLGVEEMSGVVSTDSGLHLIYRIA
jgi:NIMA-interacting peptidyl-prolyl cis-trans isomerase 1